jgi:hypothetical protein
MRLGLLIQQVGNSGSTAWSPQFMTWYMDTEYSMRSLCDIANPYQRAPEVSTVGDTYSHLDLDSAAGMLAA